MFARSPIVGYAEPAASVAGGGGGGYVLQGWLLSTYIYLSFLDVITVHTVESFQLFKGLWMGL